MSLKAYLERWSRGWRGPALAALIALVAGLPGLFSIPPLDRDESRFAQATAQMLETRDFVVIRYQDEPRFKKPVGIHWLQAASVSLLSESEAREIWAYRLPSLLGAMLAAAACAWGARAFFGGPAGLLAGGLLGATFLLSTEASIAKTDAVLAGTTTLAMAALARIYASARGGQPVGWTTRMLFWLGLAGATLVKGPVGPLVVGLTIAALVVAERRAGWLKSLGWDWGLILFAAVVGPWAWAVTVATDGAFWAEALGADLAPKLAGGHETHGAPPGYHTLLASLLFFPGTLLLPAALAFGWRARTNPGVRFALCWLIPTWLLFEFAPTKLVHYTLPAYGALAWLAAAALHEPLGRLVRWAGAVLCAVSGGVFAAIVFFLVSEFGDRSDVTAATIAGGLFVAAGLTGAYLIVRGAPGVALVSTAALGVIAHGALSAGLVPRLDPLFLSREVAQTMAEARLLPRQGVTTPPVAVAGYAEPSLVFALGTPTVLGGAGQAAEAIVAGRPAVVESREAAAFRQALAARDATAELVGEVRGLNYSNGTPMILRIYTARTAPPQARAQ